MLQRSRVARCISCGVYERADAESDLGMSHSLHSSVQGPCLLHHRSHHRSFGSALWMATPEGAMTPEVHEMNSGTGPGQIASETGYGHVPARRSGGEGLPTSVS
jgi:hypothetical protein